MHLVVCCDSRPYHFTAHLAFKNSAQSMYKYFMSPIGQHLLNLHFILYNFHQTKQNYRKSTVWFWKWTIRSWVSCSVLPWMAADFCSHAFWKCTCLTWNDALLLYSNMKVYFISDVLVCCKYLFTVSNILMFSSEWMFISLQNIKKNKFWNLERMMRSPWQNFGISIFSVFNTLCWFIV